MLTPLLLRRRRLVRLRLRPLLPHAHQPCLTPRLPKRSVCILCPLWHLTLLNLTNCLFLGWVNHGHVPLHKTALLVVFLNVFFGGVHFLELASLAGEENEALAVSLQTGDVCGERFLGEVGATRVDGDTDSGSEGAGDACFLKKGIDISFRNAHSYHSYRVIAAILRLIHLQFCKREATTSSYATVIFN